MGKNFKAKAEMQEEATDELEKYLEGKPWETNKAKAGTVNVRPVGPAAIAGKPAAAKPLGVRPMIPAVKAVAAGARPLGLAGARPMMGTFGPGSQLAKAAVPQVARLPGQLIAGGLPGQAGGVKRPLSAVTPTTGPLAKAPKISAPKLPAMKGTAARPPGVSAARPLLAGRPAGAVLGIRA